MTLKICKQVLFFGPNSLTGAINKKTAYILYHSATTLKMYTYTQVTNEKEATHTHTVYIRKMLAHQAVAKFIMPWHRYSNGFKKKMNFFYISMFGKNNCFALFSVYKLKCFKGVGVNCRNSILREGLNVLCIE